MTEYGDVGRREAQDKAAEFFMELWNAPIKRVAIENPVGVMSRRFRKPDQIVHPWWFGAREAKRTCLWLRELPWLLPNERQRPQWERRDNYTAWGRADKRTSKKRLVTAPELALAMAEQWG